MHCNSAGPCWQGLALDIPLGRKSFTAQDSHLSQALRSWHFPKGVGSHKSKPMTMLNRNDHCRAHGCSLDKGGDGQRELTRQSLKCFITKNSTVLIKRCPVPLEHAVEMSTADQGPTRLYLGNGLGPHRVRGLL